MRKQFLFLFMFAFLFLSLASVSAVPPVTTVQQFADGYSITVHPITQYFPEGEDVKFHAHVFNQSNGVPINSSIECFFHLYNNTNHKVTLSTTTVDDLFDYEFLVLGGNFTKDVTSYHVFCENGVGGDYEYAIQITPTGEPKDNTQLFSRIFLILLSIFIIILIQRNRKTVNYDKWYSNMVKKYQERNIVKFSLSAVGYNLMTNSWIFSYLVGLLGLLILTDLTYFFNINSALDIMKIVLGLYSWSAILVSLIFFSQVQEWMVGWVKDIQNLKWGDMTK